MKQIADSAPAFMNRRLQVVAGKGGVGRTLVASAIALRAARLGKRTLLLEINAPDHCARALDVTPVVDSPRTVLENLDLCRMTPAGSLREYAIMMLKFRALYRIVFENPLVKYFLRSVPALGEFTMLGKAWYHAQETKPNGSPKYDCVIVDAPATGHAITFLSVARVVANTVPRGPMKTAAIKMANWIEDSENACVHVVLTPEEMPVNEALELQKKLVRDVNLTMGLGFINRVSMSRFSETDRASLDKLKDMTTIEPGLSPYLNAVEIRQERERHQAAYCKRFESDSGLGLVIIEDIDWLDSDQERVKHLAQSWNMNKAASVQRGDA